LERISVNFSAGQIDEQTCDRILGILELYEFPPTAFEVEITETMLMKQGEAAITQLEKMRRHGISISLDDFGTGYSSLYQIHRLPINKLKIDRAFVKHIPAHADHTRLTAIIIDMARTFSLQVVAEGVESEEQYTYLSNKGCDFFQGRYLAGPLSVDELNVVVVP
ncbi:MAG: EAL domain-containing protein, partial [Pseudomonadales bacterium]|nr:EAL domain-containing protein [Pseudomonadales bacterium]